MTARTPDEADRRIGEKVRTRRVQLGLTQQALADRISVSYQQVQKYENGSNRIPGSRLNELAHALGVPASYFYSESDDTSRLIACFSAITDQNKRRAILSFVESMA